MKTRIEFLNGRPMINIDEINHSSLAYTTYFDECGEWSDFIKSGYRMFFVNVSFNDLPINNITGFSPFLTGVFEPGFLYSKVHDIAIASRIPEQKGMDLPPLIFAQSGAIYFEK